jgi:hypothetical protein
MSSSKSAVVRVGAVLAALLMVGLAAVAIACAGGGSADSFEGDGGDAAVEASGGGFDPQGPTIYVSTAGSDSANGQSPSSAVQTIKVALGLAASCPGAPCLVKVAAGRFVAEVDLVDGVSIYGGYSIDFSMRDIANEVVVLSSTTSQAVLANGLTKPTVLDGFTIVGSDLSADVDGGVSYALAVRNSGMALSVANAIIVGGTGARGAVGAQGGATSCNAGGGTGGVATDCASATGSPGNAAGDTATAGDGGGGGDNDCPSACPLVGGDGVSDGQPGAPGGNGAGGVGGSPAVVGFGSFTTGVWVGGAGGPGGAGLNGTGGGGGGSGGTKKIAACFGCGSLIGGTGGTGGAGGCGGGGGAGGGTGGAAIAVLIQSSEPTFQNVTVQGGTGGIGGVGGGGGMGALGGTIIDAGMTGAPSQTCGLINYSAGGGGFGGAGGAGGAGGGGAGGNGGPSIGIAIVGSADMPANPTIKMGVGGAGGRGGDGGDGASGVGQPGKSGPAVAQQTF